MHHDAHQAGRNVRANTGQAVDALHQQHHFRPVGVERGRKPLHAVEDALARLAAVDDGNRRTPARGTSPAVAPATPTGTTRSAAPPAGAPSPGACAIGLVTSPAVKLSPNAMKRVRDRRATPGVGAVGPLVPEQPATAVHASARIKNARCIETNDHISVAHSLAARTYSSTFLASTSSGTLPPSTTVSLNALRS